MCHWRWEGNLASTLTPGHGHGNRLDLAPDICNSVSINACVAHPPANVSVFEMVEIRKPDLMHIKHEPASNTSPTRQGHFQSSMHRQTIGTS